MTTPPGPAERVGDAERQQAIDLLGEHWRAGRLGPGEHEARTTQAFSAVTRGDLDALFADLPEPRPTTPGTVAPTYGAATVPTPTPTTGVTPAPDRPSFLDRRRDTIMAVTPFVALILFFATDTWLWFLAIPLMGALLYTGHTGRSSDQSARDARRAARRADRDRRRDER